MSLSISLVASSQIVPLTQAVFLELLGNKEFLVGRVLGYYKPGSLIGEEPDDHAIFFDGIQNNPGKYAVSAFEHPHVIAQCGGDNLRFSLLENDKLRITRLIGTSTPNVQDMRFVAPDEKPIISFQQPLQDPEFFEAVAQDGKLFIEPDWQIYDFDIVCEVCPGIVYGSKYGSYKLYLDMARYKNLTIFASVAPVFKTCAEYSVIIYHFAGDEFLESLKDVVGVDFDESRTHSVVAITRPDLVTPEK